jgi:Reverse transcriptase (RNA-dependent DNA polymerase)
MAGWWRRQRRGPRQGSPLPPLLSNVMLDDLDWELDKRGLRFVRYADDRRVYLQSRRAGERVMQSVTRYVEQRLKLRVNRQKSAVERATRRPLLGFGFFVRGRDQGADRSKGPRAGQRSAASAHLAHLGRADGATDTCDQSLNRRVDGLLRVG